MGAEESRAFSINDKGQIVGAVRNDTLWEFFLWDEQTGLQVLNFNFPKMEHPSELHLNNKGQISGMYLEEIFFWDPLSGLKVYPGVGPHAYIVKMNDNGQLLLCSWDEPRSFYLWSDGNLENITADFYLKFPNYKSGAPLMNNSGDVIINAYSPEFKNIAILYKDGVYTELFKNFGERGGNIIDLDDLGNVLVCYDQKISVYFVNLESGSQIECKSYGLETLVSNYRIINNVPQMLYCSPSVLKSGVNGTKYYLPGMEIMKLLANTDTPYCIPKEDRFDFHQKFRISSQNSKGYVLGECPTYYLNQSHAFLAVPVTSFD
ncbi:MAG: hypothetical protein CK425_11275 [Parachlamydia sp.]|nr:MAG: hypothetical protein CK425_11275 [Parachlamydia sp.]